MLPRLKFEIQPLVIEMLDRLPATVWTDPTVTFLDPAMAGGQFLVEIIRKLRDNGHSDENIASRVYGLAEDVIDLGYAKRTKKLIGKYSVGSIETLEDWVKMGKKFDVVIGNPPYNKNGDDPLYYDFVKYLSTICTGHFSYIVPVGWLVGPRAKPLRDYVFSNLKITNMRMLTKEAFEHNVTQNTVVISGIVGQPTDTFIFERQVGAIWSVVTVDVGMDIFDNGMPMYITEEGKKLIHAANKFHTKFALLRTTNQPCVLISDANRSTEYSSDKSIQWYLNDAIRGFVVSDVGATKPNRNHHACKTPAEAQNLHAWMTSTAARLIFVMWAASHRNIGSNLGQVPAVIVPGQYSDAAAYAMLGLDQDTIDWIESVK